MKTALYRHFDAAGRLLYVGITNHTPRRLAQHSERSAWFTQSARVTIEWHPTREKALEAERLAVVSERPLHNVRLVVAQPTKHVAWGVLHLSSGRFDGWYFKPEDGIEMLEFFREEFPGERFALVARTERQPAQTGRAPLRPHESAKWLRAAS